MYDLELVEAAKNSNRCQVIEYLANGADAKFDDSDALKWACYNNDEEIVEILLIHGADPKVSGSCLSYAIESKNKKVCEMLIANGADVETSLCDAAYTTKDLYLADFLVSSGANPRVLDDTPLRWAAERGHHDWVKFLLNLGADPNARNGYAVIYAAYGGFIETAKALLESGADVHARNDLAIFWAMEEGHNEMVELLLAYGADPKARSNANESIRKSSF